MNPVKENAPLRAEEVGPSGSTQSHAERRWIILLCVLAGLRVFLFSSAFPFFSNVDEYTHFDQVVKYSNGQWPLGMDKFDKESAVIICLCTSPEYMKKPSAFANNAFPPPTWTLPVDQRSYLVAKDAPQYLRTTSIESVQPPLYYMIAGVWYRIGKILGLGDSIFVLYWTRFINILAIMILVWISYAFMRRFYPTNRFLTYAVPLLVGFIPQDLFYGITNDVLSPILYSVALYFLLDIYLSKEKSYLYYLVAGLSIACTMLVKLFNAPILVVAMVIIGVRIRDDWRSKQLGSTLGKTGVIVAGAFAPILAWVIRNYVVMGSPTAIGQFNDMAGWKPKSFIQIWNHPIFTAHGIALFWNDLMASFWRGEYYWHNARLAWHSMDLFYSISSLILLLCAALWIFGSSDRNGSENAVDRIAFLALGAGVLMLIGASLRYDFGTIWPGPNRTYPYYTNARLIYGAVIPFSILYLRGLEFILTRIRIKPLLPAALGLIVVGMTYSEVVMSLGVFASKYNWFHMW
jgi:hypothetical protein